MGYTLEGFVARREVLERAALGVGHARVVALRSAVVSRDEFALLPWTNALHAEISADEARYEPFWSLSQNAKIWAREKSRNGALAFLEINLFGGTGERAAIVWRDGEVIYGPRANKDGSSRYERGVWQGEDVPLRENATNEALRILGVQVGDALDEFEALGLAQHRSTSEWV